MKEKVKPAMVTPVAPHTIYRGPMEGIIIVDGRPQMECLDMPSISFESIQALRRATQQSD